MHAKRKNKRKKKKKDIIMSLDLTTSAITVTVANIELEKCCQVLFPFILQLLLYTSPQLVLNRLIFLYK